jgi:drug/metabolite transporter (DMT)-like permease
METNITTPNKPATNGKTMAGIIILIIGGLLLINQLNLFFIPDWLFSWPMWIIAYGLYMGGKYNFRKPVWIWMIVIGTAFLFTENIHDSEQIVWPIAIIGVGAWMVMKHSNKPADVRYPGSNYKEI